MKEHINFRNSFLPPFYFVLSLWFIHLFQTWAEVDLGNWGIYPRESIGLRGILFAPLLHGSWSHLASNSLPFVILATILIYFYPRVAIRASIVIYFLTGILVWLFARSGVFHIGLSYVVYGLVSFVFWTGVFRRSIRSIILALLVTLFYSGMVEGILPTPEILQRNISWESHLIGGIVGIFVAYFFKEELEEGEKEEYNLASEETNFYFERDVFDKTLEQKRIEALEQEYQNYLIEQERRRQQFLSNPNWTTDSTL